MCNTSDELSINIQSAELIKAWKVNQIRGYLKKISGKTSYSLQIDGDTIQVTPFKSLLAAQAVERGIFEILGDMCENLNSGSSSNCSSLYNCCDCGSGNCGCSYCFSCNACEACQGELD